MAKYSTGGSSGGGGGDSCELCGSPSENLAVANVAGANLSVCPDCRPYDDTAHKDRKQREADQSRDQEEPDRRKRAAQNAAQASGAWNDDSERWEREGTDYDDDQLPYLVSGYGTRLESARQAAGLQREELAAALDASEADIIAIEQGRATQAGIGGSLVAALEERLDVELVE